MDRNDRIDVTTHAANVGLGFSTFQAPVSVTQELWEKCVNWSEVDTDAQIYQEHDARLYDILTTSATAIELNAQQFLETMELEVSVLVVPRDGYSTDPVTADIRIGGVPAEGVIVIDLLGFRKLKEF